MSAIGDYIHRSLRGYKSGEKSPRISDASKAYKIKKSQIEQQILSSEADLKLEQQAKVLENVLNEFLGQNKGSPDYEAQLKKFNDEVFIKEFPQYITDQFLKVNRNRAGMKVQEIGVKGNIPLQTVSKKLEQIDNIIQTISKGKIDTSTADKLQETYNNLQTTFSQMQTNIKTGQKSINAKKNENFFTELNMLINELQFSNELMYAKGKALELFVPFVVDYINKAVKGKVDFAISQKQGGKDSRSLPGIATQYFTPDKRVDLEKVMGRQKEKISKYSDFIPSIQIPTEDKVDFYLAIDGSDMGFTAKNYVISSERFKGITLVKQQSLLTLLQNENDENFVNHYFTLIQPLDCEGEKGLNRIIAYQHEYNRLVYKLLLVKALTGYNVLKYNESGADNKIFTTDAAQFLIINDSAKSNYTENNIKIISTKTLINNILINPNSASLSTGSKHGYNYNSFANFTLQEQPYKKDSFNTPQERITDILMKVHAQKIHMALKPGFVRQSIFGYNTTASNT